MTSPPFRFTIFDLDSCLAVAKAVDAGGGVLSSAALAACQHSWQRRFGLVSCRPSL